MTINNRKVTCAGCQKQYPVLDTKMYRRKRCCGSQECHIIIDKKVTNFNYQKQQKKLAKGTYRHGVPIDLKNQIIKRDNNVCRLCNNVCAEFTTQVHHIIPVSANGQDDPINLVVLCSSCHMNVHRTGWEQYQNDFEDYTKTAEANNPTVVYSNSR